MDLERALTLLDSSLGKLGSQAEAEAWGLPVWVLWWTYEQYVPLTQQLAATVTGVIPGPVGLVQPTDPPDALRCEPHGGQYEISSENIAPLVGLTTDRAAVEAVHRAMTAAAFGTYAALLRDAAQPGTASVSEGKRLQERAAVADQAAMRATAALEAIPDEAWAPALRELAHRLDDTAARAIVTPTPERRHKWHSTAH